MTEASQVLLPRAWYQASLRDFSSTDPDAIVGQLALCAAFTVTTEQIFAWKAQLELLKRELAGVDGWILLEFNIPRMGRRVDAVIVVGSTVFATEFKVGASRFDRSAIDQAWDYALDIKNFHEGSHGVPIVPIVVATEAAAAPIATPQFSSDLVCSPIHVGATGLRAAIDAVLQHTGTIDEIIVGSWVAAPYRPTPTIVEAARALYAQHSVAAITRHDAGAKNLQITSRRLEDIIDEARRFQRKVICFVTGVPGAGKTLVGLDVATRRREDNRQTHAVYLSGNGPLVAVLREALTRDEVARFRERGEKSRKAKLANPVKAFIQNVHHFRDEALRDAGPPDDHVVIFDEAQRAWNRQKTSLFMKQRKGQPNFADSEPEFLISYMDRHSDWAVIICLVGGGQEIHTGEAGIGAWLEAVRTRFRDWYVYVSPRLTDTEYAATHALDMAAGLPHSHLDDSLHLAVSMRSFRAEHVSAFVKALLDRDAEDARRHLRQIESRFPIVVTRDLGRAKMWIRSRARGTEQYGLLASSKAMRLKPHAIDVRVTIDPVHWFLNERSDTRSCCFLEDCATEFQVQGLELDWTCINWDGDLRVGESGWNYHDFRGDRWQSIRNPENQRYLLNAYRVLLTRARQGMVVFVPPGDSADPTRLPEMYDATFSYLSGIGIAAI